jgi:hypothetical protein
MRNKYTNRFYLERDIDVSMLTKKITEFKFINIKFYYI